MTTTLVAIQRIFIFLKKKWSTSPEWSLSEFVVMRDEVSYPKEETQCQLWYFFTSLKLAKSLKDKKTSIVGTVNEIRREIPKIYKNKEAATTFFNYFESWQRNNDGNSGKNIKKNLIVLTTVHRNATISGNPPKITVCGILQPNKIRCWQYWSDAQTIQNKSGVFFIIAYIYPSSILSLFTERLQKSVLAAKILFWNLWKNFKLTVGRFLIQKKMRPKNLFRKWGKPARYTNASKENQSGIMKYIKGTKFTCGKCTVKITMRVTGSICQTK